MYRVVKSASDCQGLQNNLDHLVQWSLTWGMEFNVAKCNVMSTTLKRKNNRIMFDYRMSGKPLNRSNSEKYLGVTINSKLEWGEHIDKVCGTATRLLGFLQRAMHRCPPKLKEKAYKAIVRPGMEYAVSVWDPHQTKYINKLEMIQRRAARFVTNNPHRRTSLQPSVSAMVESLGWDSLEQRRQRSRVTTMYKAVNNLVDIPSHYLPPRQLREGLRGHSHAFSHATSTVDAHKYAFMQRTRVDWNNLTEQAVQERTLDSFKTCLSTLQL